MSHKIFYLLSLLVTLLLIVACNPQEQQRLEIVVPNPPCELISGEQVSMSVSGNLSSDTQVNWSVGDGQLSKEDGLTTVYVAPQVTSDTDMIIVASVRTEGEVTPITLVCRVFSTQETSNDFPSRVVEPEPSPVITLPPIASPQSESTDQRLPTFKCVLFAFGSYYPLLQIVEQELDEQNGFQLELIPWPLPPYDEVPFEDITEKIRSGEWDCILDTLDSPARKGNYGVITAVIDESAGADQVWVKPNIIKLNDFEGQRISYIPESTSEFLLLALLDLVGLTPSDIVQIPATDMADAVARFNRDEVDVVVGWEPDIAEAQNSGGRKLLDSSELRYIVDVIVVSKQAIDNYPNTVTDFHRAWFQALRFQFDNFANAAQSIAGWGNNEWTFVYEETAESDLQSWLTSIAQAGIGPNLIVMQNPNILYERIRHARAIWELAYPQLPSLDIEASVDPSFVLSLQGESSSLSAHHGPYNPTFSMAGQPVPPPPDANWLVIVDLAKCGTDFEFLPNTTILSDEAQERLDDCALPVLRSLSATVYLRITGSSAWPGPPFGNFTEEQVSNFALQRALAVAQYISNQGIPANHLLIDYVIPPPERQQIVNESELAKDRFVKLELVTSGAR